MSAHITGEMTAHTVELDRQLHDIAWGLLITLTGVIWLVPANLVPDGGWLAGVAFILLGVNLVRYVNRIPINHLSTALGMLASVAAISRFWRQDLPVLAICLVIIGMSLTLRPLLKRGG